MEGYYIDSNTEDKQYGIYDYLSRNSNIKTMGGCNKDRYIFQIGIGDHYVANNYIDEAIGNKDLIFSTYRDIKGSVIINISYINKQSSPNEFEYECVLGILNECIEYQKEYDTNIKVEVSKSFFIDNEERFTNDILSVINDLENSINRKRR